jgi:3-hydroxyacyl-[acyl-carrier-protein] dehydratase
MNDIAAHFLVPHDHPSLAGHFPGRPIVPGVVLLDAVCAALRTASSGKLTLTTIVSTKFLQAVAPQTRIELRIKLTAEADERWKARFTATHAGATVLEGSLLLTSDAATESAT